MKIPIAKAAGIEQHAVGQNPASVAWRWVEVALVAVGWLGRLVVGVRVSRGRR